MSSTISLPAVAEAPASPEQLARENMPLAKYLAVEKARTAEHVDLDDLLSAAYLGLATASLEYEPARGIPFGAYARTKITWSLLNEMRNADPAGERSREKIQRVRVAGELVRVRTGRAATLPELAAESGLDADVVSRMQLLDEMVRTGTSFEAHFEGSDGPGAVDPSGSLILPEHAVEQAEKHEMLERILSALPDRMQRVIREVYLDDRMVKDIAADLEVSHAYVSKLRRTGLLLLREALDAWEGGTEPDRSTASKAAFFDAVFGPVSARADLAVPA